MISKNKGIYKIKMSKEELYNLYINNKKSSLEISKIKNCSNSSVLKRLKIFEIPIRDKRECLREWYEKNKGSQKHIEMYKNIMRKRDETKNQRKKEGQKYIFGCAKNSMENPKKFSGENNPFYGKKHSTDTLKRLEKVRYSKIRGKSFKELYGENKANEIKLKQRESLIKYNLNIDPEKEIERGKKISKTKKRLISEGRLNPLKGNLNPSKPELILNRIIQKNNLPFNHVGDGKIYFQGPNHFFNPDFLSKNPKHIIEVFGDYWHNRKDTKLKDIERLKTYSKYGYKTLIIWENELVPRWGKQLTEQQIVNKIRRFINGTNF